MRSPRRRPVVYRVQVWTWLATVVTSTVLVVLFVPTARQQAVAFAILGLAAVAAVMIWRVSEYRVHRLGPVTSTGSNGSLIVTLVMTLSLARIVGGGGSYLASVAGFATGLALGLPVLTWITALRATAPTATRDGSAPPPDAER